MLLGFVLIFATWGIALALIPWASDNCDWTLPLILSIGVSGSIAAVCIQ